VTSRIVVALRVPGSPERAFRVFTEETALWWRDDQMVRFTPRSPGEMAFEPPEGGRPGRFVERLPNGKVFEIGQVSVWDPGRRLQFAWRQASFAPGQGTEVEITFEAAGGETRVTVEHRGWDGVPAENAARHHMPLLLFSQHHAAWWRAQLASLKERTR
jgi:uncharacterized protein YndB with AHSA1/START domain